MNDGAIVGRESGNWVAGSSPLQYEVRNPSGNWIPSLPTTERQSNRRTDTMACVSYSLINAIETQLQHLYGVDVNFSDRWLAKMSNTQINGNYLYIVAETVRKFGLVPQESWPEPPDYTWSSYYAPIPSHIQDKGLEFLENWTINWEWVDVTKDNLLKHLKQSPLQLVRPGHAVMEFYQENDVIQYFDTYDPFQKTIPVSGISDALKIVITPKNMNQFKTQNKNGELRIVLQASSMEEWKALCKVYGKNPNVVDETVT